MGHLVYLCQNNWNTNKDEKLVFPPRMPRAGKTTRFSFKPGDNKLIYDIHVAELAVELLLVPVAPESASPRVDVGVDEVPLARQVRAPVHLELLLDVLSARASEPAKESCVLNHNQDCTYVGR